MLAAGVKMESELFVLFDYCYKISVDQLNLRDPRSVTQNCPFNKHPYICPYV